MIRVAAGRPATYLGRMDKMPEDWLASLDWSAIAEELDETGGAVIGPLLTAGDCETLRDLWDTADFRSRIDMRRHGFGSGEYRYFAAPLPPLVATLRAAAYLRLAPIANAWAERLGGDFRAPPVLDEMLARCHAAGQTRPTPLLLSYCAGDYNCLHQDLYGEIAFPLQLVVQLSRPGEDFLGRRVRPRRAAPPNAVAPDRPRPAAGARRRLRDQPEAPPRRRAAGHPRSCATASAGSPRAAA